jgi:hypothetical protein
MVSALLAVLTAVGPPATPPAARVDNPPIKISLNSDAYFERGDRARVKIRAEQDGYVIVLRADVDGRVRVLFPLDPGDDNFVRGGKDYTLPGRGDRETFIVGDQTGDGTILAAFSLEPFQYNQFVRGDHWDYRVLASDHMQDDPEAGLLDLVSAMADSAHFDYDVMTYTVASRLAYRGYYGGPCFGCGYGYGYGGFGVRVGLAFGAPYYRYGLAYCDPFYDPFFCDPFFYDPYYGAGYYYPSYYGRGGSCFSNPFCFGRGGFAYSPRRTYGGFVFKPNRPLPPTILPRQRFPVAMAPSTAQPRLSRDWGTTTARPVEPRRRAPTPAARPAPTARPAPSGGRTWSPPPQRRPAAPPPRARDNHRGHYESWQGRTPALRDRGSSPDRGRSGWAPSRPTRSFPSFSRPNPSFSRPETRSRQAPGFGRSFAAPSIRGSFGGGIRSAPRVSRPAPRRH